MSDTQTTGTTETSTTTDSGGGDGSFTAGELAFINSRGEDASGLEETAAKPVESEARQSARVETAADEGGDAVDGEVRIEGDGTVRDTKTGRFVPHGAFAKERSARQEAEKSRQELTEKFARADERLQILTGAIDPATTKAEAAAPIDPETDIFGALKHALGKIEALEKQASDRDTSAKASEDARGMADAYRADAERFAKATPDFGAAYTYVIKGRDAELQALGVSDAKERAQIIASDERDLVQGAISSKLSPAERLYKYAQAKGFKSVPTDNVASEKTAGNADGIDKLALIEKGQLATRSLASAGGGAPVGLTLESLLAMSTEEFGEFASKNGAKLKAMMGG